jgi:RNA polymerase subunit RPABC4/transcription elongation factor Spt4
MNSQTFPDIPCPVLAYLLDLPGPPRALSVRSLMGTPSPLTPNQISELLNGRMIRYGDDGVMELSPEFRPVASVLLAPRTTVNVRTWENDGNRGETVLLFPGTIVEGRGVVLNKVDDNYRIRAFVSDADVFELVRPGLPVEEGQALEFETLVDPPTAAVLFGIMDLARNKTDSSVPGHDAGVPTVLSVQKISQYLTEAWGLNGPKDFITYIAAAGLMNAPPTSAEIFQAMISLGEAGALVEAASGEYAVSPAIEALARLADGFQGGIQWKRTSLPGSGALEASNRIFLFGSASPILCFSPAADGVVWVSAVLKQDIVDFLADEIASRPHAGRASAPKPLKKAPAAAPAKPILPACASCGRELKPGRNFCIYCGAAVSAQKTAGASSPESNKVCARCGTTVRPTAKFCKTCGAPLS